jgi:DNA repair protein RecO (recombination protein O)
MKEGEGIIIEVREYSNSSLILKFFTKEGKVSGFLKGGLKQKEKTAIFSIISFKLNRRVEEHLGLLKIEVIKNYSSLIVKKRLRLCILCVLQEILTFLLQDEMPEDDLYLKTIHFLEFLILDNLDTDIIIQYLLYELDLLTILGFGLDFSSCALTGSLDIFFISPVTGRCASFNSAKDIKDKLFEIPYIYGNKASSFQNTKEDLINAFEINSHFLQNVPNYEKLSSRQKLRSFICSL